MKNLILLFLFYIISCNTYIFPNSEQIELFSKGNEHFQNREFEDAASYYERIIELGFEGVPVYYNLGNAYYRLDKIGLAILNYEKALKLSPGDEDILYNLEIAKANTVDQLQDLPRLFLINWLESFISFISVDGWTILSYIFYLLVLAAFSLYYFGRKIEIQKWGLLSGIILSLIFIITTIILFVNINRDISSQFAIMVENRSEVKLEPNSESGDAFIIHEGIKVKIEEEFDGWKRIRLTDGKVGWINKDKLRTI